ncbi:MAG: asparagine synthase (glutamine-hydrolyzing) [Chloroflexi bacterium]|nr:asparagine synthase (glutamine-hydrolyzing) [Chloroflexota bacterium]
MCGIAGVLDRSGSASSADLARMLAALRHRGPDDEGMASFGPLSMGMRRLSILDPTPAGHQPMASEDGRSWIVFNGEIYNFEELARELEAAGCSFDSASDTEVILAAYTVWGPRCVERFNGIWAFALWDDERQTLLLSRDRFGVKPLFVAEQAGRFAFASEIKALLRLPWVANDPDMSTVRDYLVDGWVDHTNHTFFRAIRQLPAAHNLVVTREGQTIERFWGPPPLSDDARAAPDAADGRRIDEVRDLLIDAVALQLRSDVTVGSCLSGGLDSSGIVTIAAGLRERHIRLSPEHLRGRETQPHLAFFAEFHDEDIDERRFVDAVAAAAGLGVRTTTPTPDVFPTSLQPIVRAQDEPFPSTSIVAGSIASVIVKDHPAHAASGLSPLKLYESMAAGVPVVVSALPGLQDTIERHDCGIVVPATVVAAVAHAVATLAASRDLRKRLGENGRRAALAHYSWQVSAEATARVVERAVRRHARTDH